MATKRVKKTVITGVTREAAEQAFADYAAADAKVQGITARMDQEMTRIREKYADQLAGAGRHQGTQLRDYPDLRHGEQGGAVQQEKEYGIRPRRVRISHRHSQAEEPERFTWAAVTNLCKELLPGYIRTTEELAKDKLLADRAIEEVAPSSPR